MKIITLMRLKDQEERLVEQFPNIDFTFYKHPNVVEDHDLNDADVLIGYHKEVDEHFLRKCKNLKLIAWYATGVNNLPLEYIQSRGIKLTNARGVHAIQMAEFIFAYMLIDMKQFKETIEAQNSKKYLNKVEVETLYNQTILFLGTGAIPQRTASIAKAFNMNVIGINRTGHSVENFDEVYSIEERKEIFYKANFIVNILPETEETIHLLQEEDFKCMSRDAHFINVGRGTIVSEAVLTNALEQKLIRRASLDVFENEPLEDSSKLFTLDNVTLTPHITGNDKNNIKRCTDILVDNLQNNPNAHFENLYNQVNINNGY